MRTRVLDFALLAVMGAIGATTIVWVIAGGFNALIAGAVTAIAK